MLKEYATPVHTLEEARERIDTINKAWREDSDAVVKEMGGLQDALEAQAATIAEQARTLAIWERVGTTPAKAVMMAERIATLEARNAELEGLLHCALPWLETDYHYTDRGRLVKKIRAALPVPVRNVPRGSPAETGARLADTMNRHGPDTPEGKAALDELCRVAPPKVDGK